MSDAGRGVTAEGSTAHHDDGNATPKNQEKQEPQPPTDPISRLFIAILNFGIDDGLVAVVNTVIGFLVLALGFSWYVGAANIHILVMGMLTLGLLVSMNW